MNNADINSGDDVREPEELHPVQFVRRQPDQGAVYIRYDATPRGSKEDPKSSSAPESAESLPPEQPKPREVRLPPPERPRPQMKGVVDVQLPGEQPPKRPRTPAQQAHAEKMKRLAQERRIARENAEIAQSSADSATAEKASAPEAPIF